MSSIERESALLIAFLALCYVLLNSPGRQDQDDSDDSVTEDAIGFQTVEDPDPDLDHNYQKGK